MVMYVLYEYIIFSQFNVFQSIFYPHPEAIYPLSIHHTICVDSHDLTAYCVRETISVAHTHLTHIYFKLVTLIAGFGAPCGAIKSLDRSILAST